VACRPIKQINNDGRTGRATGPSGILAFWHPRSGVCRLWWTGV